MDVGSELLPVRFLPKGRTKFKFGTWLDGRRDHEEYQFLISENGVPSNSAVFAKRAARGRD